MDNENIKRIEHPADPERCQHTAANGQCINKSIPGTQKCAAHSPRHDRKEARLYKIQAYQSRIDQFASHQDIFSLRDEISLCRLLVEEIWNKAGKNTDQLLMFSSSIGSYIDKLAKLVPLCQRMEKTYGAMLEKTQVLRIAANLVEIVSEAIKDSGIPDSQIDQILDEIADKVIRAVDEESKPSEDTE